MSDVTLDGLDVWQSSFSTQTMTLPKIPDLIQCDAEATKDLWGVSQGFWFNPATDYTPVGHTYAEIFHYTGASASAWASIFWDTFSDAGIKKNGLFYGRDLKLNTSDMLELCGFLSIPVAFNTWDDSINFDDNAVRIER